MQYMIRKGWEAGYRLLPLVALICVAGITGFAQTTCTPGATSPTVHAEGLAEQIGDISLTCSGGTYPMNAVVIIGTNANITNRLDINGNPTNITVSGTAVIGPSSPPTLNGLKTLVFYSIQLNAPGTFTISGIRVAVPTANGGTVGASLIQATITSSGLTIPNAPLFVGLTSPTLLSSVVNNGIPCTGSAAPATMDFPGLIAAGTTSSTVRVTEASATAFQPKAATADFGVRFLVSLSGYGSNTQVYVPDVIVGNGSYATAAGNYSMPINGGTFVPGTNQLLLVRVGGADGTGNGGGPVLQTVPSVLTNFASVTQIPLVSGAATVTYEVLIASPVVDSAQIPVFVSAPVTNCTTVPANNLGAALAPASTVTTATMTDPIPRYIATTPASDCNAIGDCSAPYFPALAVSAGSAGTPSLSLTGQLSGPVETGAITIQNGGGNVLSFTATSAYQFASGQTGGNWLSITPTSGIVGTAVGIPAAGIAVSANPAALTAVGVYQATVTISAGAAGSATVPITFTVGPAGPMIQSIVNSANSQPGPITAGSFATIYGLNLVPKNPPATVTFDGYPATIFYDGQPSTASPAQINVLVPASVSPFSSVGVVATIDGVATATYAASLVPNAPAVFTPGILNQNNSVNLASSPASAGDIVQIFLTGLSTPVNVPLTVTIGTTSLSGSQIIYSGPVASVTGLEQVNVQVPVGLAFTGNSAPLSICVPGATGKALCSAPVNLYLH